VPAEPPVGPSAKTARTVSRLWPLVSGAVVVALVVAGGLLIMARSAAPEIDIEWMAEIVEHRSPFWQVPALVMNFLGGGWFATYLVPLGIVGLFCLVRRFWAALYFAVATGVSVALVQLLKHLLERARPLDQLVVSDAGSFPSGHVANAATMAAVFVLIFWRVWVWTAAAAYTALMMLSRTYLGVHWRTDTIGGLLLGAAVAVIVWAPLADRLRREANRRSAGNVSG
jgi:undecaprenyl-diphosphatase